MNECPYRVISAQPSSTDKPVRNSRVPVAWAIATACCFAGAYGVQITSRVFLFDVRAAVLAGFGAAGMIGTITSLVLWARRAPAGPRGVHGVASLFIAVGAAVVSTAGALQAGRWVGNPARELWPLADAAAMETSPGWQLTSEHRRNSSTFMESIPASIDRVWSAPTSLTATTREFGRRHPEMSSSLSYDMSWPSGRRPAMSVHVSYRDAESRSVKISFGIPDGQRARRSEITPILVAPRGWERLAVEAYPPSGVFVEEAAVEFSAPGSRAAVVWQLSRRFGRAANVTTTLNFRKDETAGDRVWVFVTMHNGELPGTTTVSAHANYG